MACKQETKSDDSAHAYKDASFGSNGCFGCQIEVERQEDLSLQVAILRVVTVHHVQCSCLDRVVELILVQMIASFSHEEVRPSRDLNSVLVFVVLDHGESLTKKMCIEERIERVSMHAESSCVASTSSKWAAIRAILLFRQIFYDTSDNDN